MDCIFCKIANGEIPGKILYQDDDVMAIMDINPICDGHALIIPKKHFEDIIEVSDEVFNKMRKAAILVGTKMMQITNEKGYTFTINYGDKQEVKHLHLHVFPDYKKPCTKSIDEIFNEYKKLSN